MGFGCVVARFGLFLRQLQFFRQPGSASSTGLSLWFGTALIAEGVLVNLSSAIRHVQLVRELDKAETEGSRSLIPALATALFLTLIALVLAICLAFVHGSANIASQRIKQKTMTPS